MSRAYFRNGIRNMMPVAGSVKPQSTGWMGKCCGASMRLISIVAYSVVLITIAALEFGDPSWTLFLHTVKTVSAAGVFNYSLTPPAVMYYNLSELPEYITLDGTTIGEPVGIFSPVLVACIALGLAILSHLMFLFMIPLSGTSYCLSENTVATISTLVNNVTKVIIVILVFMASGMRDIGSIMLICAVQVSIMFMYFVLLHSNPPPGEYDPIPPQDSEASQRLNSTNKDPEANITLGRTVVDDSNMVLRLTLLLVLVFQYVSLGVVISGNYVQISMLYVTAVFLFVHDLFYYLVMAVLVPSNFSCGDMGSTGDIKVYMAIFFDWLIVVPIPFFLYFSLHNAVAT